MTKNGIDLKKLSITELDSNFENARQNFTEKLKGFQSKQILLKSHLSSVGNFQFDITIPDDILRSDLLAKLEKAQIPFDQSRKTIKTNMAGTATLTSILDDEKIREIISLENEIHSRINEKSSYHTISRIDSDKGYQWAVWDEKLSNTYYFKSLSDMQVSLEKGYIKKPYEPLNVSHWRLPSSYPKNWEYPSNMRPLKKPEDQRLQLMIDGGDTVANTLQDSHLPHLLTYALQATIVYPLFMYAVRYGFKGSREENEGSTKELLENINQKRELRKLLIDSLVRETKVKHELSCEMNKNEDITKDSKPYKLFHSLGQEGAIRKNLNEIADLLSSDKKIDEKTLKEIEARMALTKKEADKIELTNNKIVSRETIENLSDRKFFKMMSQEASKLSDNPELYPEFVKDLSQWKQLNDNTFVKQIQAYLGNQLAKPGMSWAWWAMGVFEGAALLETLGHGATQIPAVANTIAIAETIGKSFAVAGQAAIALYGLIDAADGLHKVMSINEWVKKIDQSELVDTDTKKLIVNYLNDRKTHAIIGKCVGSSMLSLGQLMMILGGPAVGLGLPVAITGTTMSLFSVVLRLTNNMVEQRKYCINTNSSPDEKTILNDNKSMPSNGKRVGETDYHANLRWKSESLLTLQKEQQEKLAWSTIYSNIIKHCESHKEPQNPVELNNAVLSIGKGTLSKFTVAKSFDNMQTTVEELIAKYDTSRKIEDAISMFYSNKIKFYSEMSLNTLSSSKNSKTNVLPEILTDDQKLYSHPKAQETLDLFHKLRESNVLSDFTRRILKHLVITHKATDNIRGNHFSRYITNVETARHRYHFIPTVLGVREWRFKSPILPYQKKTVYFFKEDQFLSDLKSYDKLEPEEKRVLDKLWNIIIEEKNSSLGKFFEKDGNLKLKSDVYRPLWIEIPQLVYQEYLDKKFVDKSTLGPVEIKPTHVPEKEAVQRNLTIIKTNNIPEKELLPQLSVNC